ncbi:resolvase [Cyanobium sp. CH-040]|uniref:resolvase n=1 Tax=Cyanobium sp. CH-040 TaxID=2823708 RepID=UPI0020CDD438|nr:resolvase [Cyanobium sp. CH-040]MCP9927363.1 resolvase [Cyanobium sp. CH-040]
MREAGLLAAVDPGRSKCGVVLADPLSRTVLAAAILSPQEARERIAQWQQQGMAAVVLGNGTGSAAWQHDLRQLGLTVLLVDERGSTLAARERYWDLEGRRHWRRWLPAGLRLPPRAIDDVVAQLLLERHLGCTLAPAAGPLRTGPGP